MQSTLSTIWNKERETRTVNVDGLYRGRSLYRRMRQSGNPWLGMNTGRIDKTKYFDVQETLKRHNKDRMIWSVRYPRAWESLSLAEVRPSNTDGGLVLNWDRTKSDHPTKGYESARKRIRRRRIWSQSLISFDIDLKTFYRTDFLGRLLRPWSPH